MPDTDSFLAQQSDNSFDTAITNKYLEKPLWAPRKECRSWNVEGEFFACYLLISSHPRGKNCIYIGSTNDPNRRIRQHNGEIACGAHQTLKKRPWEIAILAFGFPSHLSALQFEWAWQKPHLSRYINRDFPGIYHKKMSEQYLPTKLRVLAHLLQCSGFSRWPLNLHFLSSQVQAQFNENLKSDPSSLIPKHIPITSGSLNLVFPPVAENPGLPSNLDQKYCYSCKNSGHQMLKCSNGTCQKMFHLSCLASKFSSEAMFIIPIQGECPKCNHILVWGKLIQNMSAKESSLLAKADEN